MATKLLVRRRAKRGRPRKDEVVAKTIKVLPVFVARDPQGIKLFTAKPRLSVFGVWEGKMLDGVKPMGPRTFIVKYRNAVLPVRGRLLEMRMGV